MQAVILCGGLGMRLREETEYRPKPMVEIGGKPILWHILKIYEYYGIREFILCLGYKGEIIKDYFLNYQAMNNDFKVKFGMSGYTRILANKTEEFEITLADTGLRSMTGYRVKKIEKYLSGDTFMLTYGDGVGDINLSNLLDFHRSHGKTGTLTGVSPISRFGEMTLEGDQVVNFSEKPLQCHTYVNGGFFVLNRDFFSYLSEDENLVLEKAPLETLARDGELMVYKHCDFWHSMDTMRDKEHLESLWESGNAPWKIWKD